MLTHATAWINLEDTMLSEISQTQKDKYYMIPLIWGASSTGIPHFALHFIVFFYKLKVCGNPASSKSIGTIFPTAFAHFLSLCHILVILTIFQTFPWLFYLLWWSVVFDITIVIVLGRHEPCPYKTENLINVMLVGTAQPTGRSPSLPLLRPPYSLRYNNIEIKSINNPTMAPKCSSERKSPTSLTLNQKLEIKLSEEGMSKLRQTES